MNRKAALRVKPGMTLFNTHYKRAETITKVFLRRSKKHPKGKFPLFSTDRDPDPTTYLLFRSLTNEEVARVVVDAHNARQDPPIARTRIQKWADSGEYQVKAYDLDDKRLPNSDYFTDDLTDAENTAKAMINTVRVVGDKPQWPKEVNPCSVCGGIDTCYCEEDRDDA